MIPSLILCNQQVGMLDMPVNFKFPLDASSLSETDFEVLDSQIPYLCFFGSTENRTVLLLNLVKRGIKLKLFLKSAHPLVFYILELINLNE